VLPVVFHTYASLINAARVENGRSRLDCTCRTSAGREHERDRYLDVTRSPPSRFIARVITERAIMSRDYISRLFVSVRRAGSSRSSVKPGLHLTLIARYCYGTSLPVDKRISAPPRAREVRGDSCSAACGERTLEFVGRRGSSTLLAASSSGKGEFPRRSAPRNFTLEEKKGDDFARESLVADR